MKKALVILAVLLSFGCSKQEHHQHGQGAFNWTDPSSQFSTSKNFTNTSTVNWKPVDNIQTTCEIESKARGLGGFGYKVEACSFWTGNSCTVFTRKSTNIHTVGHEVLHCFQGPYH